MCRNHLPENCLRCVNRVGWGSIESGVRGYGGVRRGWGRTSVLLVFNEVSSGSESIREVTKGSHAGENDSCETTRHSLETNFVWLDWNQLSVCKLTHVCTRTQQWCHVREAVWPQRVRIGGCLLQLTRDAGRGQFGLSPGGGSSKFYFRHTDSWAWGPAKMTLQKPNTPPKRFHFPNEAHYICLPLWVHGACSLQLTQNLKCFASGKYNQTPCTFFILIWRSFEWKIFMLCCWTHFLPRHFWFFLCFWCPLIWKLSEIAK